MEAEAKQRFGVHVGGEWGYMVHTWHWGEPNHGPQKSSQMGRGMGAVPGVTHLDLEESILLQ